MGRTSKVLMSVAFALVALALAGNSANAAEFAISPAGEVNAVSSGKVTFQTELATIECDVTLSLSLTNSSIVKTDGAFIGTVNSVTIRACTGGNVNAVLNLTWETRYKAIIGTLASGVSGAKLILINAQFRFGIFFELVNCLYAGDVGVTLGLSLVRGSENRYTTGSLQPNEEQSISYVSGPGSCPAEGSMRGTFTLSTTQTLTRT